VYTIKPTANMVALLATTKLKYIPILANNHAIMGLPSCPFPDLMTLMVVQASPNWSAIKTASSMYVIFIP